MMSNPQELIAGYLDETLSPEEHAEFVQWLQGSADNQRLFARAVLLHDRLRGELHAVAEMKAVSSSVAVPGRLSKVRSSGHRAMAAISAVAVAVIAIIAVWKGVGETPASAAVVELDRLISVSAQSTDRTYQIAVEEMISEASRAKWDVMVRPPKPPMDGAVLHVRHGNKFVLLRTTPEGSPFVTGSNGHSSWAVRPEGPVRVSSDVTRFHRDLPGHEHSMPLINIDEGLERLRAAYEIQLLPVEVPDEGRQGAEPPLRLLVAVKKRGQRGPRRVEITYVVSTGQIRELRFVDMPYGPDRLTLRLTLVEQRELGSAFFDHASHHDSARRVEFEE